ncbi:MAG: hypothetical protein ACOCX2_02785 [Armatimonadota bacterium]
MPTVRWTTLGPPTSPRVSFVRGVGWVRVTQEDVDRYGETFLQDDQELELERVTDDPEARFSISGPAAKTNYFVEEPAARKPPVETTRRGGKRGWLATLLGR